MSSIKATVEERIDGPARRIRAGVSGLVDASYAIYWPLNGHSFGLSPVLRGNAETSLRSFVKLYLSDE